MRFSIAALSLFSSVVLTAPALRHDIVTVSDFTVRNIDNAIEAVEFNIAGNITCSATKPTKVIACGDSAYRFFIAENTLDNYNLTIYEELGPAVGLYEKQAVETICHAGPVSNTDYICFNPYNVTYTLTFDGN